MSQSSENFDQDFILIHEQSSFAPPPDAVTDAMTDAEDDAVPLEEIFAQTPDADDKPSERRGRLSRNFSILLIVLAVLVVLFCLPNVAERFYYFMTRGKMQAEAEVARELLKEIKNVQEIIPWVVKAAEPSVVGIESHRHITLPDGTRLAQTEEGSGVFVDADGYVLTNHHVVAGSEKFVISLSDGRKLEDVTVVGFDPIIDLAVLRVQSPLQKVDSSLGEKFIPIPWGNSTEAEVGETVIAIGNPYGFSHTVTSGILSAKERYLQDSSGYRTQEYLQIDAAINPGNSGGPLVNVRGELIGINTLITHESFSGIGLAIPSNLAKQVYEQIRKSGVVLHGWIGIRMRPVSKDDIKDIGTATTNGVFVIETVRGGAAEKAGLERGDIIISIDGKKVNDIVHFAHTIIMTTPQTNLTLEVIREGETKEIEVTVGRRPQFYRRR
ncbi:MAG: trypsin-like peptidase domain-containing protein [Planctomycetaceae bacterium]|jgi:serine protease Do|nr:trypsin-like peptidase domain-containing protein [Planctomycetaceae bacterium]